MQDRPDKARLRSVRKVEDEAQRVNDVTGLLTL